MGQMIQINEQETTVNMGDLDAHCAWIGCSRFSLTLAKHAGEDVWQLGNGDASSLSSREGRSIVSPPQVPVTVSTFICLWGLEGAVITDTSR